MSFITFYVKQKDRPGNQRSARLLRRTVLGLLRREQILWLPFGFLILAACPDRQLDDARSLLEAGKLDEAGRAFVALARADPANLAAWDGAVQVWCRDQINVGECMSVLDLELKLLGNLQRHRDALSEVLERRARARLEQGLIDAAFADLARAEKAAPERASVYVAQARAHMMRGDRAAMLEALDRAKKRDPGLAEADALYRIVPSSTTAEDAFGGPQATPRSTE